MGPKRSRYMLITGVSVSGTEAAQIRLNNVAVPREDLLRKVESICGETWRFGFPHDEGNP